MTDNPQKSVMFESIIFLAIRLMRFAMKNGRFSDLQMIGIHIEYIPPGKHRPNAHIKDYNGRFTDERLNVETFYSLR